MKTPSRHFISFLVGLFSVSLFAGCAPARKPLPNPPPQGKSAYPLPGTPAKRPAPSPEDIRRLDMMLIRRVNSLSGVKNSSVAVLGSTAYVGVEKKANLSDTLTRDLKRDIPLAVKNFEPRITTVMLSFRADTKKLIAKVANDIGQGRPASVYSGDLKQIIYSSEPVR